MFGKHKKPLNKYDVCMLLENGFQNDSRVLREARSLANQRLNVLLLALYDPGMTPQVQWVEGFRVQRIPVWSRRFKGKWALGLKAAEFMVRYTLSALKAGARVYHSHDTTPLLPAVIAAKLHRAGLVYDCHELTIGLPNNSPIKRRLIKLYEGRLLPFVDRVIMSDGESRASVFRSTYNYTRPIGYIYNCPVSVDLSDNRRDLRKELNLSATDRLVIYTGLIGPFRGLEVAIRSMALWPANAHFVMIGRRAESDEQRLIDLAREQGVQRRVHFWGPVAPDEVALWVVTADVALVLFQNAGLSYYYSTPTKMFEAIMGRVPQVTSDFPEMRKVVVDNPVGPVGELVDPADPEAIGKMVRCLLENDARRETYRRNADTLARSCYNWETQEQALLGIYQELLR